MRGNPRIRQGGSPGAGSIPAYAGEPVVLLLPVCACRVYPRVCGGTKGWFALQPLCKGLSPRMRGNLQGLGLTLHDVRSIPAYAGEPPAGPYRTAIVEVYPRVCGGTDNSASGTNWARGLSPRMRGNPLPTCINSVSAGVYPRVCGGTPAISPRPRCQSGLSPRMRGNLVLVLSGLAVRRSIPAYAGEPPAAPGQLAGRQVYPRVCGGTYYAAYAYVAGTGLSPRMRGNPVNDKELRLSARSIPAYAGEPRPYRPGRDASQVYPRVCGGTCPSASHMWSAKGLSPRMRGNLALVPAILCAFRSIPAYAGEPRRGRLPSRRRPGILYIGRRCAL